MKWLDFNCVVDIKHEAKVVKKIVNKFSIVTEEQLTICFASQLSGIKVWSHYDCLANFHKQNPVLSIWNPCN